MQHLREDITSPVINPKKNVLPDKLYEITERVNARSYLLLNVLYSDKKVVCQGKKHRRQLITSAEVHVLGKLVSETDAGSIHISSINK